MRKMLILPIVSMVLATIGATAALAAVPTCSFKSLPGGAQALSQIAAMIRLSVGDVLAAKNIPVSKDTIQIRMTPQCTREIPHGHTELDWQDTYSYKVRVDASMKNPKGGILVMDSISFSCNGSTVSKAFDEKGAPAGKTFYDVFFLSDYGFGPYEVKNPTSDESIGSLEDSVAFQKMVPIYGKI